MATPRAAGSQDPMRPWAHWRTVEAGIYRFHFPAEYERWTVEAARRVAAIDSAITRLVGSGPPRRVDVVVHDPFQASNGYVIPLLDGPTTVWWATPPTPRSGIGDYRSWSEMLAAHELTHITHLTRPSRRPLRRFFWSLLPARVGPIAQRSPRWVIEGYATVIEGQVTGSGRPNGVWRPALLRQWAIEGRLPTYAQLSGSPEFSGGDYPYLVGSGYLEWLLRRQGDSSLVHVWRRLTARTARGFDDAFRGVFGEPPDVLYGRYVAELTGDAMRARADLERAGLREGELVQRLTWNTGDPAVSPDGSRLALTRHERDKPPRLVVWTTGPEPVDSARERQRAVAQQRDPEDVPARSFLPPAKRAERTLPAANGLPYLYPRWLADGRRLMVTRWAPRGDGTLVPDLYLWTAGSGALQRITVGEGVLQGDPSPDSREAVAMRCHAGHCDIVRIYLTLGGVTSLLEGSPQRSYYRPRYSPNGQQFVAAVSDSGHWHLVIADRDGRNARVIGPDDGVNRYDAQWLAGGDSLVLVSERGGIPNLEVMSVATGGVRALTRVTGAAVAPDVSREDRSIWFLSLQARGYDVRRLAADAETADSALAVESDRFGFAGLQRSPGLTLAAHRVGPVEDYGRGPSHWRWLPGAQVSADGVGAGLALFRGDLVGRVGTLLSAAAGETGTWQGAALRAAWRYPRPALEIGAHAFVHEPSRGRDAWFESDVLNARGFQGVLATSRTFLGDGWRVGARLGGAGGIIDPGFGASHLRRLGFGELDIQLRQVAGARGAVERLRLHAAQGAMRAPFRRIMGTLHLGTTGTDVFPIEGSLTAGQLEGSRHPFEEFSIGGAVGSVMDSSVMTQRHAMPMLPTGVARGRKLMAWRVAFPGRVTVFAEGASVAAERFLRFSEWHRVLGVETRLAVPPIPVAFAPGGQTRAGLAWSADRPFKGRVRAYIAMRYEP